MNRHITRRSVARGAMLVLLLFGITSVAQAQAVTGQVRAADGMPLPGVNVVVSAVERGAVTNEDGRYLLEALPPGEHTLSFRFVGFATETRTVALEAGETRTLNITLQPMTLETDEVVITGEGAQTALLNKATLSVSTLEARDLEAVRGQTLGETLEALPGVTTLSTGPSIAKPVVRGLHSQRLVLLNAGVPDRKSVV